MTPPARTDHEVAVVHGTAFESGGGVRVARALARTFDAPLYFGLCHDDVFERAAEELDVRRLFGSTWPLGLEQRSTLRHVYYLWRFQHVPELQQYDVVILSSSGTRWYHPTENQTVVWYVHSPAAVPYHRYPEVASSGTARLLGMVSRVLRTPTLRYPAVLVANSELTRRRIQTYWNRDATVVHPPVDVASFAPRNREDFYFTMSRLTHAKGVDEVVTTFTEELPNERLVVAGSGPEEARLRRLAGENVEIRGWVSEEEKRELLGSCKAFVLNSGNESFGIVLVEALASGAPVVTATGGNAEYLVDGGRTGILYEPGELVEAVECFEANGVEGDPDDIASSAEQYAESAFRERMTNVIRTVTEDAGETLDPESEPPNHDR